MMVGLSEKTTVTIQDTARNGKKTCRDELDGAAGNYSRQCKCYGQEFEVYM